MFGFSKGFREKNVISVEWMNEWISDICQNNTHLQLLRQGLYLAPIVEIKDECRKNNHIVYESD